MRSSSSGAVRAWPSSWARRYRELLGGAGHDWASALRAVAQGQKHLGKKELRGIIARRREGLA